MAPSEPIHPELQGARGPSFHSLICPSLFFNLCSLSPSFWALGLQQ